MISKDFLEYQRISIDTVDVNCKTSGIVNFCGLYWGYNSTEDSGNTNYYYHYYNSYEPVLTFNKIQQAEHEREQFQQERAPYELTKARDKNKDGAAHNSEEKFPRLFGPDPSSRGIFHHGMTDLLSASLTNEEKEKELELKRKADLRYQQYREGKHHIDIDIAIPNDRDKEDVCD